MVKLIKKFSPSSTFAIEKYRGLKKLETIADKPKHGQNVQHRQLQMWLSEDEYAQVEAEWQEQPMTS